MSVDYVSTRCHDARMTIVLSAQDRRRVCAEAACDERTLLRYCEGAPVRSTSAYRIAKALVALGLMPPT